MPSPKKPAAKKPAAKKTPPKPTGSAEKRAQDQALQSIIADMEKKYGENVLRKASDLTATSTIRIPTGNFALDVPLGGGYPVGRFIMLSGDYSTSKSTVGYHAIREFQNTVNPESGLPLRALLLQGEQGSYTREYGELIGIDNDQLIINESGGMEESLEIGIKLMRAGVVQLIMIDSIAALEPTKEYEKSMDDSMQMGIAPKMWGEFTRKFQATNNFLSRQGKMPCTVIAINQLREKIGSMSRDPSYEPGGKALGFTSSLTIRFKRGEWITRGSGNNQEVVGHVTKFKINKSKVSKPFITGQWDFYLEDDEKTKTRKGHFDNFKSLIIESVMFGVVQKSGAWFSYEDIKVQGADKLVDALRDRPEDYARIAELTLAAAKEANAGAIDRLIAENERDGAGEGDEADE